MDFNDETDFVFRCLLGAYIQSLRQHRGPLHLQSGVTGLQQEGRRRRGGREDQGQCGCKLGCRNLTKAAAGALLYIYYQGAPLFSGMIFFL